MSLAADLVRTLPHNLEAERSILGAILMHNDAFLEATKYVRSGDFFRDAHRRIYAAMERCLEHVNSSCDLVTLKEDLGRRGELEEVGGPAYISSLIDGVPRSVNIGHYASIVKNSSLLRALIATGNKIVTDAYCAEEPATEILERADRSLVELQHGHAVGRMRSTAQSYSELMDALEWRVQHRGQLTGINTGFPSINDQTSGWQRGDSIVIAARPSMGKTTFVLNTAVAAARAGARVAIFSMEMRRIQLEFRMLSSLSGVALSPIMGGYISEEHWPKISQASAEIHELGIYIDDSAGQTVWDIRSSCRRVKAEAGLGMVVVDYVQLMQGSGERRGMNRQEEIAEISRKLKIMADELSVPVLLLSQLTRGGEGREPELSDLRESGALEQDADLVCFIHCKDHRESGPRKFIIKKQRNGPTGSVNLTMERECTRFVDGGEWPAELQRQQTEDEKQHAKTRAIIRNQQTKRR